MPESTDAGNFFLLTTDKKIYRYVSEKWSETSVENGIYENVLYMKGEASQNVPSFNYIMSLKGSDLLTSIDDYLFFFVSSFVDSIIDTNREIFI